jgi:hypothetical protein
MCSFRKTVSKRVWLRPVVARILAGYERAPYSEPLSNGLGSLLADGDGSWHDQTIKKRLERSVMDPIVETGREITLPPSGPVNPLKRHNRVQIATALGLAAVSDVLSIWLTFTPPFQWALDLVTAGILFVIFGRRWALLPGLAMEAIPGMGVFPWWVLVVLSIVFYDGIKKPRKYGSGPVL